MAFSGRMNRSQYNRSIEVMHFAKAKPARPRKPKPIPWEWRLGQMTCFAMTKSEARAEFKRMLGASSLTGKVEKIS